MVMKYLLSFIMIATLIASCGPSAEERETQRLQDSTKAEEERLKAIEEADAFILNNMTENDTIAEATE